MNGKLQYNVPATSGYHVFTLGGDFDNVANVGGTNVAGTRMATIYPKGTGIDTYASGVMTMGSMGLTDSGVLSTSATAGSGAGTMSVYPAKYWSISIGGVTYKIPLFNV